MACGIDQIYCLLRSIFRNIRKRRSKGRNKEKERLNMRSCVTFFTSQLFTNARLYMKLMTNKYLFLILERYPMLRTVTAQKWGGSYTFPNPYKEV